MFSGCDKTPNMTIMQCQDQRQTYLTLASTDDEWKSIRSFSQVIKISTQNGQHKKNIYWMSQLQTWVGSGGGYLFSDVTKDPSSFQLFQFCHSYQICSHAYRKMAAISMVQEEQEAVSSESFLGV